jgi:hypothetical protein
MRRASTTVVIAALAMAAVFLAAGVDAVKRPKVNFKYDAKEHPNVRTITSADFRERIMDPTLPAIVQFYDPRSQASKDFAPAVNEACGALAGHISSCAGMDGTSEEGKGLLQMFTGSNTPSLPATLLFNPEMLPVAGGQEGQYMKFPAQFGGKRTTQALVQWALEFSAGHEIDRLEDMVDWKDFTAKNSFVHDLPKFVLVTSSNVTSPLYKTLSHEFRYGGAFAAIHSANLTEAAAAARGDEVTTLKGELLALLGLGADPERDALPMIAVATGAQSNDFELIRTAGNPDVGIEALKAELAKHAWPIEKRQEAMSIFLEQMQQRRKREAAEAKMNQAIPPVTAYDAATFEEHCVKRKKGFCAAVFVEDPEDEEKLAWLQGASRKMAQRVNVPSRLVVVNALQQFELAQFFGATDSGYPTVVFINPGRKQYYNLIGSFSERGVVNFFVDRAAKGKGKAYDPRKVPAFAEPKTEDDDAAGGGGGAGGGNDDVDAEEIAGDL